MNEICKIVDLIILVKNTIKDVRIEVENESDIKFLFSYKIKLMSMGFFKKFKLNSKNFSKYFGYY